MLTKIVFKALRLSGLPSLFRLLFQRKNVTILLMHDISLETAKQSFDYLSSRYAVISLSEFLKTQRVGDHSKLDPYSLIITFDDGHKRNYQLLPLIRESEIPITIFLTSSVVSTNRHFWFLHPLDDSLSIEKLKRLPNAERLEALSKNGFDQTKEFSDRQALSFDELSAMKKLVDFGAHSLFHPCLPMCGEREARKEILGSKEMLEEILDTEILTFSYPNGDYSDRDIEIVKQAGYQCGITVDFGYNHLNSDPFRLKRLSVNDTNNLDELIVKSSGLWAFLKHRLAGKIGYGFNPNPEV